MIKNYKQMNKEGLFKLYEYYILLLKIAYLIKKYNISIINNFHFFIFLKVKLES